MDAISIEAYEILNDENGGVCTSCGEHAYGIEPDARNYKCEYCGQNSVFGAEELLVMGLVE